MHEHTPGFTSLTDVGVAAKLGEVKGSVLSLGYELEGEMSTPLAIFVNDMMKELEGHTCRIALIGQMKAGKSSLINALIRRPSLLPTDINPSTAVVTKLFLGAPQEKRDSALFHFFSDDEWQRLMHGGRFSASAATPLPVAPHRLSQKLEELRERAESRLGANYARHLGKHHLFSSVTSEIMGQYVSAGGHDEPQDGGVQRPQFSDITKLAEIYLGGQPFAYPAMIIDTPGVNDPFFVRDEFTHANLADVDIYLVVLTAQQPLSSSDLGLLRMLRGLKKNKIITVINRIDLLDDVTRTGAELVDYVRETLQREFPQAVIPVLLASASWAHGALSADAPDTPALFTPVLQRYAEDRGLVRHGEIRGWQESGAWPEQKAAEVLCACSGIPGIIATIARTIGNAVTEERLLPASSTLGALAENTSISSRFGMQALDPTQAGRTASIGAYRQQIRASLKSFDTLLHDLERALKTTQQEWDQLVADELERLRKYMFYSVENFGETQEAALAASPSLRTFLQNFPGETLRFRAELAEHFVRHFSDISKNFLTRQRELESKLRNIAKEILPSLDNVLQFGLVSSRIQPPSIMPLSKVTAFDISDIWEALGKEKIGDGSAEAMHAAFRQLVQSEFTGIVAELTEQAHTDLTATLRAGLRRIRYMCYSGVYPIADQLRQIVEVLPEDGDDDDLLPARWNDLAKEWRQGVSRCEVLAQSIKEAKKQCLIIAAG